MTLVMAIATWDFIVVASDRRLTWPDGSLADDNANKLVQFDEVGVWGYTGLAKISGTRTDHWLADVVSQNAQNGLTPVLRAIRAAGDAAVASVRTPFGLAFLGSFWARPEGEPPVRPVLSCISNFHADWEAPTPNANHAFLIHHRALNERDEVLVTSVGTQVSPRVLTVLRRLIRRRIVRARAGDTAHQVLGGELEAIAVRSIQSVAQKDPRVGRGVLVACLPRPLGSRPDLIIISGVPDTLSPTFRYYPPAGGDPWSYGPIVVTRSGTTVTGFRSRPL